MRVIIEPESMFPSVPAPPDVEPTDAADDYTFAAHEHLYVHGDLPTLPDDIPTGLLVTILVVSAIATIGISLAAYAGWLSP